MTAGGVIALVDPATLVSPTDVINNAARIYAGYLASRNLALAAALLAAMMLRARGALGSLMMLTAFIQIGDAVIDCAEGRWSIVPGGCGSGRAVYPGRGASLRLSLLERGRVEAIAIAAKQQCYAHAPAGRRGQ
jgi:hypothetical protein